MRNPSSRRKMSFTRWLCIATVTLLAFGCGDGGGGGGSTDDVEFLDFSAFGLPYDSVEDCIEHVETTGNVFDRTCLCENCLDIMQECDVLKGCVAIRNCAFESGCRGAFECYLLPNAPCVEVINNFGTGSAGTALSLALGECGMDTCE